MQFPQSAATILKSMLASAASSLSSLVKPREAASDSQPWCIPHQIATGAATPQNASANVTQASRPSLAAAGGRREKDTASGTQTCEKIDTQSALDMPTLLKLNEFAVPAGKEPFAVRAARLYLKSAPSQFANMQAGFEAEDAVAVRLATHTLKSSSNSLGALKLANYAASLEALARTNTLQGADAMKSAIEHEFPRVCAELELFISRAVGDPQS